MIVRGIVTVLLFSSAGLASARNHDALATLAIRPPDCVKQRTRESIFVETCAFKRRHDAVAELPFDLRSWAGIYRQHGGYGGVEIALDRDGWAGYHERSDVTDPGGIEGRYRVERGELIVDLDTRGQLTNAPAQMRLVVVRWGSRRFLLPPGLAPGFVNAVNEGLAGSARMWRDFALYRENERDLPLCGLPQVEGEWMSRMHFQPLLLSITDAWPDLMPPNAFEARFQSAHYMVDLDAGSTSGVFVGMQLLKAPHWYANAHLHVDVTEVTATHARGRLTVSSENWISSNDVAVGKGTLLTTAGDERQFLACGSERADTQTPVAGKD